jgi:hypothetical protein
MRSSIRKMAITAAHRALFEAFIRAGVADA